MFKDSLLSSVFAGKGFSEVADWLRVQESLKWALVLGWFCRVFGLSLVTASMTQFRSHPCSAYLEGTRSVGS